MLSQANFFSVFVAILFQSKLGGKSERNIGRWNKVGGGCHHSVQNYCFTGTERAVLWCKLSSVYSKSPVWKRDRPACSDPGQWDRVQAFRNLWFLLLHLLDVRIRGLFQELTFNQSERRIISHFFLFSLATYTMCQLKLCFLFRSLSTDISLKTSFLLKHHHQSVLLIYDVKQRDSSRTGYVACHRVYHPGWGHAIGSSDSYRQTLAMPILTSGKLARPGANKRKKQVWNPLPASRDEYSVHGRQCTCTIVWRKK